MKLESLPLISRHPIYICVEGSTAAWLVLACWCWASLCLPPPAPAQHAEHTQRSESRLCVSCSSWLPCSDAVWSYDADLLFVKSTNYSFITTPKQINRTDAKILIPFQRRASAFALLAPIRMLVFGLSPLVAINNDKFRARDEKRSNCVF